MPMITASQARSNRGEARCGNWMGDSIASRLPALPAVESTIFTMEVHGTAKALAQIVACLEQAFRPPQIPQRTEIGQGECETILVLIPYRTQVEAAKFQT
jgi:hypothetical protein